VLGVALRIGAEGALVGSRAELEKVPPARVETVVDEVGAGDGFDAGWAYGLLKGLPPTQCARIGNALAAAALRGSGDWETFPHLQDLQRVEGLGDLL
jgi:2-dehydro-3-deoxygluconokinase